MKDTLNNFPTYFMRLYNVISWFEEHRLQVFEKSAQESIWHAEEWT
jgi:hypothetical protein